MAKVARQARHRLSGILLAMLVCIVGACATTPTPAPTPSPTPSTPVHSLPQGVQRLPLNNPYDLAPSPDGTLLADTNAPPQTVTMY